MVRGRSPFFTSVFAVLILVALPLGAALPAQDDAGQPGDAPDTEAEARPISPGVHSGMLLPVVDTADWYRFDVSGGTIGIERQLGTVAVRLHAPDGAIHPMHTLSDRVVVGDAAAGTWSLEIWTGGRGYGPYTFGLTLTTLGVPATTPVVVATFDTGTNPFHPCFRAERSHPGDDVPGYPTDSTSLGLTFGSTYEASLSASRSALNAITPWTLYHIPGTKLSFYGGDNAANELVDHHPHGSQASSMIACEAFGMGSNAQLVILNHYYNGWRDLVPMLDWVTAQDWIDVVHLNIQDIPRPIATAESDAIGRAIAAGKMVVIAAGNGVAGLLANYPMELSRFNGPPGSLIVGASDQEGYTLFSNLQPHVVADGGATRAAHPYNYGSTTFSGTSSASPLATGYVAWLLGALRAEWGHAGPGLVNISADAPRPASGPLADGVLNATELHEVVRKTADPRLSSSRYDGGQDLFYAPASPVHGTHYTKAGYGKVSEHTIHAAIEVASGRAPMPERTEDLFYEQSERIRETYWGGSEE